MKTELTKDWCMNMAKTEAAAGSPEQSIGPTPPKLTSEQLCNIGFAVLRAHNDDRLWRALTYDSGPYDLTTPNLALQELGAAFYAAGYAEAPRTTMKVEVSSDPEMVRRAMAAETEVALLRAALDQKHAEYEDLKRCAANNTRNQGLKIETLLRGINDARALIDPIWRHRMGAEQVREHVQRGLRCIDSAITDCQFTAPTAVHASDCAMHNAPAYPAGECDCGALGPNAKLTGSQRDD